MYVRDILKAKGAEVIRALPGDGFMLASELLTSHRIGVLVVIGAEQSVVGIVLERDIVQALAVRGAVALDGRCRGAPRIF